MYRLYPNFNMVLLLLLSHLNCNDPFMPTINCSRKKSHIARIVIEKKVLPIFHRYKIALPLSCPFHSRRHMLWWPVQERDFYGNHWRCPECGKIVLLEQDLLYHYDSNHLSFMTDELICMEDYCDIFRCNVLSGIIDSVHSNQNLNNKVPDHKNDLFRQFYCNQSNMLLLRSKCQAVIKQCLIDVSAVVSFKDNQDMQDELDFSICSYLTCRRYFDTTLSEVQHIPIIYCLILVFILTAIVCVCFCSASFLLNYQPDGDHRSNGFLHENTRVKSYHSKSLYNSLRPYQSHQSHVRFR